MEGFQDHAALFVDSFLDNGMFSVAAFLKIESRSKTGTDAHYAKKK